MPLARSTLGCVTSAVRALQEAAVVGPQLEPQVQLWGFSPPQCQVRPQRVIQGDAEYQRRPEHLLPELRSAEAKLPTQEVKFGLDILSEGVAEKRRQRERQAPEL
eukprot:CAMPEP_0181211922 /NCGR_PEP_ID=MMETSP1096-20121128/24058_1 /TAXON_ID=156174 ORGANISM="Chrysochromulina ericina, Strain CCMP281" /NCGR_SAMPLE_ID=MMETSP1096 /ASSEMBLY_ACC=CAM_ASM_000453 /LENGTH=104 /DNA_ID=CAMNT_0023303383 /DNA_START=459 /DNA_END=772 /DNA_ORIENTATION=-